jgi:hypothetical protein
MRVSSECSGQDHIEAADASQQKFGRRDLGRASASDGSKGGMVTGGLRCGCGASSRNGRIAIDHFVIDGLVFR